MGLWFYGTVDGVPIEATPRDPDSHITVLETSSAVRMNRLWPKKESSWCEREQDDSVEGSETNEERRLANRRTKKTTGIGRIIDSHDATSESRKCLKLDFAIVVASLCLYWLRWARCIDMRRCILLDDRRAASMDFPSCLGFQEAKKIWGLDDFYDPNLERCPTFSKFLQLEVVK